MPDTKIRKKQKKYGLRELQRAELKRFADIKLYNNMSDALRDVVERGIVEVRREKGLKPLDCTAIAE